MTARVTRDSYTVCRVAIFAASYFQTAKYHREKYIDFAPLYVLIDILIDQLLVDKIDGTYNKTRENVHTRAE